MVQIKKKSELEKEARSNIFCQILSQYDLIIDKSYSYYNIRSKKKSSEINHSFYLEAIDELTINKISVSMDAYKKIVPKDKWIDDEMLNDKTNQLNSFFRTQVLNFFKDNLSEEKFITFLDKKITKDKWDKSIDLKSVINYLHENDRELLYSYIKRPKFLIQNYNEFLEEVFIMSIHSQDKRLEIINTLKSLDVLKDNNNQNIIYKLLNKYIENPEQYYENFPNIVQPQNLDFFTSSEKTIKVGIDFLSLNSYKLTDRHYTHRDDIEIILTANLRELNNFKEALGFSSCSFDKSVENFSFYFTGENLKENVVKNCLNLLIKKSFDKKFVHEATQVKLTNAEVINFTLLEDLPSEKKPTRLHKI